MPRMRLGTVDLVELFAAVAGVALLIVSALLFASVAALILDRRRGHDIRWNGETDQKARALLRRWLSPAQLEQYEKMGHFEVVGSDSGKRYRIHRHPQMNIEEIDERGARVAFWCFVPEGNLPVGDIMLAQKIALETEERAALAIANRSPTN
jgi:hypothetical protein